MIRDPGPEDPGAIGPRLRAKRRPFGEDGENEGPIMFHYSRLGEGLWDSSVALASEASVD
jgi:hypothetical protein